MEQHPDYVAQGGINFVVLRRLYLVISRVQGRDLRSSTLLSLALVFINVTQITLSSFGAQSLAL